MSDPPTPTPRTDADERMAWNAEYMVPPETARELEREVTAMTEQRDGMAVLLSDIYNYCKGKKPHDYHNLLGSSDQIMAKFDAWQEIESKIEELLRTTPTQPEPNKMEQIECDICGGENKPGAKCDNFICPNYEPNQTKTK